MAVMRCSSRGYAPKHYNDIVKLSRVEYSRVD